MYFIVYWKVSTVITVTIALSPISIFSPFEIHFISLLDIISLIYVSLWLSVFLLAAFGTMSLDSFSHLLIPSPAVSNL